MSERPIQVSAFECWHKDTPQYRDTINASSHSKARYEYFLNVREPCPDVRLIDIRARKVGGPVSSQAFRRNAVYRGVPDLRCGDRVRVGESEGVVVDHDRCANFVVLFDSGHYNGSRLHVHPLSLELLEVRA